MDELKIEIIEEEEGIPPVLQAPLPNRVDIPMEFEHSRLAPQGLEGFPAVIRARNRVPSRLP